MSLAAKLRRAPLRAVTGTYILHSGIGKFGADAGTAKMLHGMAAGTYPFLGKVTPTLFAKGLAAGEVAVGGALLLPIVPPVVAGAALVGFSGALLNVYWNTEGMHEPGDPRPTQQGGPMAKDVWMLGIGAGLMADAILEPAHDRRVEVVAAVSEKRAAKGRQARKAKRRAKAANGDFAKQARKAAKDAQSVARKRGQKAAKKAQKQAEQASAKAGKRLTEVRDEYAPAVTERAKQARELAKGYVDEYAPVVAERAKQARETAKGYADEYAPVAAEKAQQARAAAKDARDQYAPVVAEKAKQARAAARQAAEQAQHANR